MVTVNSKFPEFKLEGYIPDELKTFTNDIFKGKWMVYLFYPADFTFVCPTELEDAAEMYDKFTEVGAEIVSVSVDTAFVHKAWHDSSPAIKKVKYPMLADVGGVLCKELGTLIENENLSYRATFIIDPDGIIKSIEMHDNSIGRNIEEILRKLQAAQFVRANGGHLVCPARWKPGAKTLKPGVDLVGKI
jgi:peroxiredoxin (alkyl hydroperoxide reductase subunit C)